MKNRGRAIPLVDLWRHHLEVEAQIANGWRRVIEEQAFILGKEGAKLEQELADYWGVGHCVAVGNGTDAIEFALRASGVKPSDNVLVPVNTFAASAFAVLRIGAHPVFVDVDEDTFLLDLNHAEREIKRGTRCLLAVHLFGQMAALEELDSLLDRFGCLLLEDAAQSHGASRHGRRSWGLAIATSFYPSKNLGAYGDGGAVMTNSSIIARRVRQLRNYGGNLKNRHNSLGWNSRLDELQAVVLRAKLPLLDSWNEARRRVAGRYHELLERGQGIIRPHELEGNEHVWHQYVVRTQEPDRDELFKSMLHARIEVAIHYPKPLHLQRAFRFLGYRRGDFPMAERLAGEMLSLPMGPHLEPHEQDRIVDVLLRVGAANGEGIKHRQSTPT